MRVMPHVAHAAVTRVSLWESQLIMKHIWIALDIEMHNPLNDITNVYSKMTTDSLQNLELPRIVTIVHAMKGKQNLLSTYIFEDALNLG